MSELWRKEVYRKESSGLVCLTRVLVVCKDGWGRPNEPMVRLFAYAIASTFDGVSKNVVDFAWGSTSKICKVVTNDDIKEVTRQALLFLQCDAVMDIIALAAFDEWSFTTGAEKEVSE